MFGMLKMWLGFFLMLGGLSMFGQMNPPWIIGGIILLAGGGFIHAKGVNEVLAVIEKK